jgi:glycosyltransferase involved in cell wall biosynthesis
MVPSRKPIISILVPVHNEEKVIELFFNRIEPVIKQLSVQYEPHLLFLNNASSDRTLDVITSIRDRHENVFVLSLARNVGYQRSLEFGLRNSIGDLFVFIDVDCEDPPEMILDFVAKHKEGFDIVYGERVDRVEIAFVKFLRKVFYRLMKMVADEEVVLDMAEFSLMTAEVRNAIIQDHSTFPFIRASIGRVGFRKVGIPYCRHNRIAGKTHYNVWGMTTFAVGGLLAASTLLLRAITYALPFWIAAMAYLGYKAALGGAAWAYTTMVVLGFIYCGSALSFISIYLARVYKNTMGRPNAFLDTRNSWPQSMGSSARTTSSQREQPPHALGTIRAPH